MNTETSEAWRLRLVKAYHSTHYRSFLPENETAWRWVISRLEVNFGEFLRSIPRESLLADLACGVGYMEHYLLGTGFRRIEAVDLSAEQIDAARRILDDRKVEHEGRVKFEARDVFDYLEGTRGLDGAAMIDLLEHFPKDRCMELLQAIKESLKPGGFLLLRTPNAEHPMAGRFYNDFTHETHFTLKSLRQCLSLAGFEIRKLDYERMPLLNGKNRAIQLVKRGVRWMGLQALGKLLRTAPEAFSEDLVAVAVR